MPELDVMGRGARFAPGDERAVEALEARVLAAFERLGTVAPFLRSVEVTIEDAVGGSSYVVAHGLGEIPNRVMTVYAENGTRSAAFDTSTAPTARLVKIKVNGSGTNTIRARLWRE